MMENIIYQDDGKKRLDKFLVNELPEHSRSQIQKLIKNGQILVNDQIVTVHHFLKLGDKISINDKLQMTNDRLTSFGADKQQDYQIKPVIVSETDDYLVINKPAGLLVHTAPGVKEATLADWLTEKYPAIKTIGDDIKRPGIVHRLDKDVSGLLVIAKSQKIFEHLKKQFQEHKIKKEYLALVYGVIKADEGQIDFVLKRSKLTGRVAALPKDVDGKTAITKFEVIKRLTHYTYLKLILLTGRTHQIRAHLFAYGHPLVGDKLYKNKKLKDKFGLTRIFLHAATLGFYNLNNEWREYNAELPKELSNILNTLS